jgi:hypothetical protein
MKHVLFAVKHVLLLLKRALVAGTLLAPPLLVGCRPDAGPPLWQIAAPRLVALQGIPAEVTPGGSVSWQALVVSPDGEAMAALSWSLCPSPRPLTTNDVVAPECLGSDVTVLGQGPSQHATVPVDACQRFGPETAPSLPGKPDPRPVAADASGGWYQPYRAELDGALSIGLQRIRCHLAGASADVAAQFQMQYQANQNPQPGPILLDGAPADGQPLRAGPHTLSLSWPAEAAESYPVFDVVSQSLVPHRETLRVSWYTTGGTLAEERTGRAAEDPALSTENSFDAPSAGPVHLWAVLRDDRGGVEWSHALLR